MVNSKVTMPLLVYDLQICFLYHDWSFHILFSYFELKAKNTTDYEDLGSNPGFHKKVIKIFLVSFLDSLSSWSDFFKSCQSAVPYKEMYIHTYICICTDRYLSVQYVLRTWLNLAEIRLGWRQNRNTVHTTNYGRLIILPNVHRNQLCNRETKNSKFKQFI